MTKEIKVTKNEMIVTLSKNGHSISTLLEMKDDTLKKAYDKIESDRIALMEKKKAFKENIKSAGLRNGKAYEAIGIAVIYDTLFGTIKTNKNDILESINSFQDGNASDSSATTSRYSLMAKVIMAYKTVTK